MFKNNKEQSNVLLLGTRKPFKLKFKLIKHSYNPAAQSLARVKSKLQCLYIHKKPQ